MVSFLKRFCAIVPGFSAADVEKYITLIQTDSTLPQPHNLFCTANIISKENNKPSQLPIQKGENKGTKKEKR